MAIQPKRDAEFEALIRQAAAEIQHLNPLIGKSLPASNVSAEDEWLRDQHEIEAIWAEMADQRQGGADLSAEPAADAVNMDRGE